MSAPHHATLVEVKNHSIYLDATFNLPIGTDIKFTNTGSVCAKNIASPSFKTTSSPQHEILLMYIADAGGGIFSACTYKRSDAQFDVAFTTPGGSQYTASNNVIQINDPNAFEIKYLNHCYRGNMPCTSGSDSAQIVFGSETVAPPGSFGPVLTAGSTKCATEDNVCTFSGSKQILYGANGQFKAKEATGSIHCSNAAFGGDPIFGVAKECWVAN